MTNSLLKKRHAPRWVGVLKYNMYAVLGYVGLSSFAGTVALVKSAFGPQFPWLTWPVIIVAVILFLALLMLINHVWGSFVDIDRNADMIWDSETKTIAYTRLNRLYNEEIMSRIGVSPSRMLELQKESGVYKWDLLEKQGEKNGS